jgi:CDP-diacylglycerol---glycerol-3-phosphate 3-phosphatidyltransferase
MNSANYFTCFRLFIGPIFIFVYMKYQWLGLSLVTMPYMLLVLMSLAEFSDVCDGYLARRFKQVTRLGKIFDPMADSLYRISLFLAFTQPPVELPLILVLIFFYRDVMISTLRTICALEGYTLAARPSGKLKAVIQAITAFLIIFLLIGFSEGLLTNSVLTITSTLIAAIAAFYSLVSGVDYIYANRIYVKNLLRNE